MEPEKRKAEFYDKVSDVLIWSLIIVPITFGFSASFFLESAISGYLMFLSCLSLVILIVANMMILKKYKKKEIEIMSDIKNKITQSTKDCPEQMSFRFPEKISDSCDLQLFLYHGIAFLKINSRFHAIAEPDAFLDHDDDYRQVNYKIGKKEYPISILPDQYLKILNKDFHGRWIAVQPGEELLRELSAC